MTTPSNTDPKMCSTDKKMADNQNTGKTLDQSSGQQGQNRPQQNQSQAGTTPNRPQQNQTSGSSYAKTSPKDDTLEDEDKDDTDTAKKSGGNW